MRCLKIPIIIVVLTVLSLVFAGCNNSTAGNTGANPGDTAAKTEHRPGSNLTRMDNKEPETKQSVNPDGKTPKLVFAELSHDFGTQTSGPDLTHTFNFKNEGDGTLIIEKVKAG